MKSEINWLMGKFLGVETHTKRAVVIFTIFMYAVWFPVNIVMGAITFNDCSVQPELPKIMISIAIVESVWWCLLFFGFGLGVKLTVKPHAPTKKKMSKY